MILTAHPVTTNEVTGVIPQLRWNDTLPIRAGRARRGKVDILTPLTNQIVRSDGTIVNPTSIQDWTGEATDASDNTGSSDRKLMSGSSALPGTNPVSLTLSNIPFAAYDLYIIRRRFV